MASLPTGTVTFLFTDIEGSTRLWEQHPDLTRTALARHDALIEEVVSRYGGHVVRPPGEGDSRFAVFSLATDAIAGAAAMQQALHAEAWPTPTPLRVRIALHTGEADLREGDYYGSAVNRCARLRAVAHGGQTLLSQVTRDLAHDALPQGIELRDLGEHLLKDLQRPEHIYQRDLPARQQTLRNTIEWSYDLLGEGEKQLFRRMAPFSGGRTLEALEAICNYDGQFQVDVLDGVESLVRSSLLRQREGLTAEPRYWMLETIHEYARDKLEETQEAHDLTREHGLYFMRLAEETAPRLVGASQQVALDRLEEEYSNLRAAMEWAAQSTDPENVAVGLRIAACLEPFWSARGYLSDGRETAGRVITQARSLAATQAGAGFANQALARPLARALAAVAGVAYRMGDYQGVNDLGEEALKLARELEDKPALLATLNPLGYAGYDQADYARAGALWDEALAIARELGNKHEIARALQRSGIHRAAQGDLKGFQSDAEQGLAIMRELDDRVGIATGLQYVSTSLYLQNDYATARPLMEESLAISRELGHKVYIIIMLGNVGNLTYLQGDYRSALASFQEALPMAKELDSRYDIVWLLAGLGAVTVELEQPAKGATLLGASETLQKSLGTGLQPDDRKIYESGLQAATGRLGEEAFHAAMQKGSAMSMEQAIEYALAED